LQNLLNQIDAKARLTSAKYYHQIPTANWFTALHQNITIAVKEKVPVEGFTGWSKKDGVTRKILNMQERNHLTENVYTQEVTVKAGGVHFVKPLLLQAFGKTTEEIHAIHLLRLDFCSVALTQGLEWMD